MVYFDHNATTPLLPQARQAWLDATERFSGNPSSPHRLGARADAALNEARENLAAHLRCDATELLFTSGATESSNTVLNAIAHDGDPDAEVWISAIEHPCVLVPAQFHFGKRLRLIPASRSGVVDLNFLSTELNRSRPALVAIMAANNETGALQPWREALALCREHGIPFFCDAAQWMGKLPAAGLGACDWVSGCAHKFGGPRGVGFLKVPRARWTPLLHGGPQEEQRRPGTENVASVLSMMAALDVREVMIGENLHAPLAAARDAFERELLNVLPGSEIVSAQAPRLWNTCAALMPDADCQQRWVVKLDKLGFAVSTGSACASGKEEPSHVVRAMNYGNAEAARMLRFSAGWETPVKDWRKLPDALRSVAEFALATPNVVR
ncbi:MAG TPA: cysteine desulfurase family protein [Candidatus Acidoferrum sp.]|nr:cysteine desulfurase family protein [Candidatus Acidoferrum sp.]